MPPTVPLTSQVTAGLELPCTVAVNCCLALTWRLALDGLTVTETPVCAAWPESGLIMKTVASTASKFEPKIVVSLWRSSLFQASLGAPEMYQEEPLSASIMPYCLSAVKITWLAGEKPEMSKLAFRRKRAPMGGY